MNRMLLEPLVEPVEGQVIGLMQCWRVSSHACTPGMGFAWVECAVSGRMPAEFICLLCWCVVLV